MKEYEIIWLSSLFYKYGNENFFENFFDIFRLISRVQRFCVYRLKKNVKSIQ